MPTFLRPVFYRYCSLDMFVDGFPFNALFIHSFYKILCTINSKINGTPKGVYLPISKLHSILAAPNLLPHIDIAIKYYLQLIIELESNVASNCASKHLWVTIMRPRPSGDVYI